MAPTPTSTRSWILANYPHGVPTFSTADDNSTFKLVEQALPDLKPNQVLVKVLFLSNDPAQRGWIDPSIPAERLYIKPVELKASMAARGLAEVIASTSDRLQIGTIVQGPVGWNEYGVLGEADCTPRQPLPNGLSLTHYMGAFGIPGLTAYYGLVVVGGAKGGQKVVVSGAAGAVGNMVVQIAKNIVGCSEVIGIAGSDEKCRWVESLGADKCLNYKSPTFEDDLIKATEGFVHVYFDNVGGSILDLMLARMAKNGVVIACGSISGYNSGKPTLLKNYFQLISMRLSIRGFIASDYLSKAQEIGKLFVQALRDGKLKISDEMEQVVATNFEDVPRTWLKLFEGANTGKLITRIVE
ncbi:quinone oxidoreductase [Elasticomyces elasticus]|uniref:Quinone oxidoreductase n=1 Tax=Exophiala sideris TaxID=1016849 RepID=A0ABR0JEZ9_9EURO|nr:quinone oxidoreductase [Elasticomyces elasticus]KAK5025246.1 quinone oxidoreductase [Exophiala sideris]KAK5029206.1 quinone oxidoreductase [Exophiala sideris]KAK5063305.1 quinone oxidoreductase [Exophiala sideris]KAK5179021.1 quinone oxidoreductase [Eurotiomycetes sp. CCFEE 6388]